MNMINSMTGYGKGEAQVDNVSLTVEIKTVNHRCWRTKFAARWVRRCGAARSMSS